MMSDYCKRSSRSRAIALNAVRIIEIKWRVGRHFQSRALLLDQIAVVGRNAEHSRLTANSSIHAAPRMIQLVGASAKGTAPYVASKGQSAAIPPAHNPTRQPNAVRPTPTTSSTAKESSTH